LLRTSSPKSTPPPFAVVKSIRKKCQFERNLRTIGRSSSPFIRLKLTGGETIPENFYWRGLEEYNYRALRDLPKVKLEAVTRATRQAGRWMLTTTVHNPAKTPVLMVKVKAVREKSGDRILPAIYSDNYIALMPGESYTVRTEVEDADTCGEPPAIVIE
jgi:hypothetical protein